MLNLQGDLHQVLTQSSAICFMRDQDKEMGGGVFSRSPYTGYWISRHISTTFVFSCRMFTAHQTTNVYCTSNHQCLLHIKPPMFTAHQTTNVYCTSNHQCLLHIKPPWHNFRPLSLLWISSVMTPPPPPPPPHYERFRLVKHTEQFQTRTTLC